MPASIHNVDFFISYLTAHNYDPRVLDLAHQYVRNQDLDVSHKMVSAWSFSDWHVKPSKKLMFGESIYAKRYGFESILTVEHHDPLFGYALHLGWYEENHTVVVLVYSKYKMAHALDFTFKMKKPRQQQSQSKNNVLLQLWNTGAVWSELQQEVAPRVSPKSGIRRFTFNTHLEDTNHKKIANYQAQAIALLYEYRSLGIADQLGSEPSFDWPLPAAVKYQFSSGFVDWLQEEHSMADSTRSGAQQFLKQYPTLEAYASSADTRYW